MKFHAVLILVTLMLFHVDGIVDVDIAVVQLAIELGVRVHCFDIDCRMLGCGSERLQHADLCDGRGVGVVARMEV